MFKEVDKPEPIEKTEIYTHITTKGFDQIKSPLDNFEL